MQSLDTYAQEKLDEIERRGLHRSISETVREDGIYIERSGKRLLSFSCNDYLNLTQHPAVHRFARTDRFEADFPSALGCQRRRQDTYVCVGLREALGTKQLQAQHRWA